MLLPEYPVHFASPLASNRLEGVVTNGQSTRTFSYDAAGNVTHDARSGVGYGYAYDAAGRMASLP